MALELRRKSKQYLKSQPVAIEDNSALSDEFFGLNDFPKYFGEGKNSFRIRPRFGVLKPNTKIDIEVLDSNGNPVYWEIPTYKDDDKSRLISVWIYDVADKRYNTPDGPCEVIILGTLPDNQKVRWSRRVDVVKNKKSVSEVVFREIPRGNVSASIETFSEIPQSEGSLSQTIQAGQFTYKKSLYGDDVSFEASTAIVNREMISGSLELDLSSTTLFPRLGGGQSQPSNVTASITEVISNQIFRVSLPITSSDNRSEGSIHTYEYSDGTVSGEIKYLSTGSLNVTQNQVAIANITLSNVNPISGRVSSVNTLIKSQGLPNADFELIANTDIPNERDISYKVAIPTEQLNDPKTLKIQFLNKSGDVSTTETIIEDVVFEGGNVYIGGNQSIVTGSLFIANAIGSGLEIGGHSSGFMKSVGYEGQISASEGTGPGGFIIYSGSNALQMGADVLTGVGMQFVGDNDDRHLIFSTANGGILDVKTDKFFIGNTNSQFISGSDSNIEISSSLFHLDPKNEILIIGSDAIIEGGLSADRIFTPATIGGSPSNITNASSSITQDGFAKFVSASIAGFTVNTEEIKSSDESLRLKSNGQMTGSAILLGDKAGGNFVQFADSTLTVRGDLAVDQITTPATIGGSPSNLTNASASITSDGFAKFVSASIGGWDITTGSIEGGNLIMKPEGILQTKDYASGVKGWKISSELNGYAEFENVKIRGTLATTTFEKESVNAVGGQLYVANSTTISGSISSSLSSVTTDVTNSFATNQQVQQSHTEIFLDDYTSVTPSNQPTMSVNDVVTLQFVGTNPNPDPSATFFTNGSDLVSATLTDLSVGVFRFGLDGGVEVGELGGGSIDPTDNSGDNFIIHYSSASLSSSIDEVYTNVSPSASSFIVDNVTGFASGEILTMKKVTNTGFSTEYVKVDSADRISGGSESDLSGYLHVTRSYGSGTTGESGSLGDIASTSQSYEEGQVIVSTGKIGSGFIRLNANPNDPSTPYMDIVERTGSGLYDIELKARLGDLSGLSNSDLVHGRSNPGFGLATDNVYLQGGIIATFGEIGGFGISANTISSSNNNLILRDNGQISGSTVLFDGGTIGGFELSSTQINSSNDNLILKANGQITASAASIDGDIVTDNITATGGTIGGFDLTSSQINSSNNNLVLKSNGQITGSAVNLTGNINAEVGIFEDIEIVGQPILSESLFLIESWATSSAALQNQHLAGSGTTFSVGSEFSYGLLNWSSSYVDNGGSSTNITSTNLVTKGYTQGGVYSDNKPPTFKQWWEFTGDYDDYPNHGNDSYRPIECAEFSTPNSTDEYSITCDTIQLPSDVASTTSLRGIVLQTAVRFGGPSGFGGFYPIARVEVLAANGTTVLAKQEKAVQNASEWLDFSIPVSSELGFYSSNQFNVRDEIRIRLTWTGAQSAGGGTISYVRWGELRLLKLADSPGIALSNITFRESGMSSGKNATEHQGDFIPARDDFFDLGSNSTGYVRRWDDIYATNGTIQTSDETEKTNITSSDLGLSFVNDLRPVSYKWVGKQRTHYGLIAQEVSSSLDTIGKTTNDFAGIVTGSLMGIRYNELISPMIKAIQELSDEVNQLKLQLSQSQG